MMRSSFTIFPESTIKTIWDCIGFAFIVYQSISIPFNLCFGAHPEGALLAFDTTIDVFFMLDVITNFNTGYYKKGVLVMNRKDIIFNYLKSWFILDLLASFPYSWVINYEEEVTTASTI